LPFPRQSAIKAAIDRAAPMLVWVAAKFSGNGDQKIDGAFAGDRQRSSRRSSRRPVNVTAAANFTVPVKEIAAVGADNRSFIDQHNRYPKPFK
jgi:hypothetical protein